MNTCLSIIIPVYNGAHWLKKALHSVIEQNFAESFEIILVDDGSIDDSVSIIKKIQSRNPSILLLRNDQNRGIVHSLNRGLDAAQGQFIARMDADDICEPMRLTRQFEFLRDNRIDLCGSWFTEFGKGVARAVRWPHMESALRTSMLFQNSICHPTVMARREVFDKLRYREEYRLAEDYDLFVRAMSSFRIANVPEVLLRYRRHQQQATHAQRAPMEAITQRIRYEVLKAEGFHPTDKEMRLHNLIRAPHSLRDLDDLLGIETWLLKLTEHYSEIDAKEVIASQWIRACIRAAPLGPHMLRAYLGSPLRGSVRSTLDLSVLAALRLDYSSKPFAVLRRLGLSA